MADELWLMPNWPAWTVRTLNGYVRRYKRLKFCLRRVSWPNDSISQNAAGRMRSTFYLTLVNRRQKGVFTSSQNKTNANKLFKTPEGSIFGPRGRPQFTAETSPPPNSHFARVLGGSRWTFRRVANSGVAAA